MIKSELLDTLSLRLGALAAFFGVALGAFGAHGLRDLLEKNQRIDTWETAVLYQLIHALALLIVAIIPGLHRRISLLFFVGILIFSGSLFILCLTNITWLGAITPIGGVCFLIAWALLFFSKLPGRQP